MGENAAPNTALGRESLELICIMYNICLLYIYMNIVFSFTYNIYIYICVHKYIYILMCRYYMLYLCMLSLPPRIHKDSSSPCDLYYIYLLFRIDSLLQVCHSHPSIWRL